MRLALGLRFVFLGTGSSEGCPGLWCRCRDCTRLARLGGRNIRGFPCAFIEPDVLIDAPCDAASLARAAGISLAQVRHVLITHSHADHLYPALFRRRYLAPGVSSAAALAAPTPIRAAQTPEQEFREPSGNKCEYRESLRSGVVSPVQSELETLHVYATAEACSKILGALIDASGGRHRLAVHQVEPFAEFTLGAGGPAVVGLPASHPLPGGETALNYVIEAAACGTGAGERPSAIFYGLDGDVPPPDSLDVLRGRRYGLVVLELGAGFLEAASSAGHLNVERLRGLVSMMRREGMVSAGSVVAVSHVSPHFTPDHDRLSAILRPDGILVAYDGMVVALEASGST